MVDVLTQAAIIVKKEGRIYSFQCDNTSPLGEVYDAIQEMRTTIVNRIQEAEAAQKPQESVPEAPKED